MTALSTLVPALQRELAVPGAFDTEFPNTTTDNLRDSLADGFAEAQLYGFFPDMTLTQDGGGDWLTEPDLSGAGGALVIIFTSMRIIRANLRSLLTSERYKAGPAEMEIQRSANLLRDELKFLKERLDSIVADSRAAARPLTTVHDNYLARGGGVTITGGLYVYEYRG